MASSQDTRTLIYVGLAFVCLAFVCFLAALDLGYNWLTDPELMSRADKGAFFAALGAFGTSASLLWTQYARRPPK